MSKTTRMAAAVLFSGVVIVSSFLGVKAMAGGGSAPVAPATRTQTPSPDRNVDRSSDDTNPADQTQTQTDDATPAQAAPAAKTPSATAPTSTTSQKAIDYLNEIALDGFEFGSAPKVAYKWTQNVQVRVEGNPTASDRAALQQVITDLNGLIGPAVKVQLVETGGNVRVWYGPEQQFKQQLADYTPGNLGYFAVNYDENSAITHSTILIDTGTEAVARAHLIREELTQSLGLFQDSWDYKDSMFYQGWTTPTQYSEIDKQIIRMLYDTRVEPGMSKSEVDALFTNN